MVVFLKSRVTKIVVSELDEHCKKSTWLNLEWNFRRCLFPLCCVPKRQWLSKALFWNGGATMSQGYFPLAISGKSVKWCFLLLAGMTTRCLILLKAACGTNMRWLFMRQPLQLSISQTAQPENWPQLSQVSAGEVCPGFIRYVWVAEASGRCGC